MRPVGASTRVDYSAGSNLPFCSCGWRGNPWTQRRDAHAEADLHRERIHGVRAAAYQRTTRERLTASQAS